MKNWYESKTIWLGIATVAVAALTQLGELPIPDSWKPAILGAVGVLNVFLRLFSTAQPIGGGQ